MNFMSAMPSYSHSYSPASLCAAPNHSACADVSAADERRRRAVEELQELRAKYAANLPAKIERLETIWHQLDCATQNEGCSETIDMSAFAAVKDREDEDVSMSTFYRLVHNLAGSGATYGFPALSREARELTNLMKPWSDPDLPPDAQPPLKSELCERIENLLAAMKAAI